MNDALDRLLEFLQVNNGIDDKTVLTKLVAESFALTKDRSVYYCDEFAIRFSSSLVKALAIRFCLSQISGSSMNVLLSFAW